MKNLISLSFIISFCSAWSQLGGDYSYTFLNLSENAKVAALGGEVISLMDTNDVNSGVYNPSLVLHDHHNGISFNFLPLKGGINKTSLVYSRELPKVGASTFYIQNMSYGSIKQTDLNGVAQGEYSVNEYVIGANAAYRQGNFRMGYGLKFAHSKLANYNASALMADLGGSFVHPKKQIVVSLLFKNLGFNVGKFTESSDQKIPFQVTSGMTFKPEHMPVRFSLTAHNMQQWDIQYLDPTQSFTIDNNGTKIPEEKRFSEQLFRHFNLGTEILLFKNLQFRIGYNHLRRKELKTPLRGGSGYSFGLLLRVKGINFEYGKSYYFAGSGSSVISITTNLNKFK